ncbi:hypothetical protein JW848_03090 [Candidatus Bipolaricaulota bacterium]|nr:hypothetical protein [Candidatus Bipolaricaulota bacterium]
MRRMLLVFVGLLVTVGGMALGQGGLFDILPSIVEPRLAYRIDPPRQITVEISDASLLVDLQHQGQLQLNASLPQAGSPYGIGAVIVNICSLWDLHGTYPGAIYYQVRPGTDLTMTWRNFALQIDVPTLSWGTPLGTGVFIVPAARFGTLPMPGEKHAIVPTPTVELGPAGMMGQVNQPYIADITFPTLSLEWFEWSQTARYRAGNVVLHSDVGWWWDDTNPNALYIGNFHIDLSSGLVSYVNWRAGGTEEPTLLNVVIDDGDPGMIYFEPDLWW